MTLAWIDLPIWYRVEDRLPVENKDDRYTHYVYVYNGIGIFKGCYSYRRDHIKNVQCACYGGWGYFKYGAWTSEQYNEILVSLGKETTYWPVTHWAEIPEIPNPAPPTN